MLLDLEVLIQNLGGFTTCEAPVKLSPGRTRM